MNYQGKDLAFLHNVDTSKNTANMQLFGVIGVDLNGDDFAKELLTLSEFGFKAVTININSVGGSIREGFSILNAMNTLRVAGTSVRTYGLGVMDSMAGIVLAFGDRGWRRATNFSSGVIHEPLIVDDSGQAITLDSLPEGEFKAELLFMRESLLTALTSSTGMAKNALREVMKAGTRRTADELRDLGLIDEVVEASNRLEISNLSRIEAMAACSGHYINLEKMEKEKSELEKLQASTATALADKDSVIADLKNQNATMQAELKAVRRHAVEAFIDGVIAEGKFKAEKREDLVIQAEKDFEAFKTLCSSLNEAFVDVTKNLTKESPEGNSQVEVLAKEYHQADLAGNLVSFKNKVGEAKYKKAEDYYTENIDKVIA